MEKEELEKRRLDYDYTVQYIFHLSDIRFKLLGLLPIATGVAFSFSNPESSPINSLILGILGFLATIGILFYDQRNTEIYDELVRRAREMEKAMELEKVRENEKFGGTFINRPKRGRKFLGVFTMWHDRGLAIIYSSVIWVWLFIIISSCVKLFEIHHPIIYWILIPISIIISITTYLNLIYLDSQSGTLKKLDSSITH